MFDALSMPNLTGKIRMKTSLNTSTNTNLRIVLIAGLMFELNTSAIAQNELSIVRTGTQSMNIVLKNSDQVAAIQFTIRSCTGISLDTFQRSGRTADTQRWSIASYKPNDSTINVLIFNMAQTFFTKGSGSIAALTYRQKSTSGSGSNRVIFTKVLIANQAAESLGVVAQNLEWSDQPTLAGNFEAPASFSFGQNYPNPFNPSTRLAYRLEKPAQVRLAVYDVIGREVSRLVDQYQFVGQFSAMWNSTDASGRVVPSGIYFAQLRVDNEVQTRKMILAK